MFFACWAHIVCSPPLFKGGGTRFLEKLKRGGKFKKKFQGGETERGGNFLEKRGGESFSTTTFYHSISQSRAFHRPIFKNFRLRRAEIITNTA